MARSPGSGVQCAGQWDQCDCWSNCRLVTLLSCHVRPAMRAQAGDTLRRQGASVHATQAPKSNVRLRRRRKKKESEDHRLARGRKHRLRLLRAGMMPRKLSAHSCWARVQVRMEGAEETQAGLLPSPTGGKYLEEGFLEQRCEPTCYEAQWTHKMPQTTAGSKEDPGGRALGPHPSTRETPCLLQWALCNVLFG